MTDRFEEVGRLLAHREVAGGSQQFRDLSMEYARLEPLARALPQLPRAGTDLAAARELQADADAGMRALGDEEVTRLQLQVDAEEEQLRLLLHAQGPARRQEHLPRGARRHRRG